MQRQPQRPLLSFWQASKCMPPIHQASTQSSSGYLPGAALASGLLPLVHDCSCRLWPGGTTSAKGTSDKLDGMSRDVIFWGMPDFTYPAAAWLSLPACTGRAPPALHHLNGVAQHVAMHSRSQLGLALPPRQGPHTAENPDGALDVNQLIVQSPALGRLLQIPFLQQARNLRIRQMAA